MFQEFFGGTLYRSHDTTPCHYYHTGRCKLSYRCKFSHSGNPRGYCPKNNCKVCQKESRERISRERRSLLSEVHSLMELLTIDVMTSEPEPEKKPVIRNIKEDEPVEEEEDPEKRCAVCLTNKRNYAFIPCGHRALCAKCARDQDKFNGKCSICREDFNCIVKIFV